MKTYSEYKTEKHFWFGDLPAHWEINTIKQRFHIKKEIAGEENIDVLSITQNGIKIKDIASNKGQLAKSYANYQRVSPGDFAMNHMDLITGWIDRSRFQGVTSPDYRVFVLDDTEGCNPDYYLRLFQLCYQRKVFFGFGRGAASKGRWRLPRSEFLSFPIPVPPREEQDQIVRFLNWKVSEVNSLIRRKRKQLTLIRELINTLASQAIERDDVQYHRLVNITIPCGASIAREEDAEYNPIGLLNRGRGIFRKPTTLGADLGDSEFFTVENNALIFSGQFAWEGAVALTNEDFEGCIASHRYHMIRAKEDIVKNEFLWAFFLTKKGDLLLNTHSRGGAGRNRPLNMNTLRKESLPIPPLEIQETIVQIVRQYNLFVKSIQQIEAKLAEYRNRMISDVVTGKVDVRGIVIPDLEPEDNIETVDEDDVDEEDLKDSDEREVIEDGNN